MTYQTVLIPAESVQVGDLTSLGDPISRVVVGRKWVHITAANVPRRYEKGTGITVTRKVADVRPTDDPHPFEPSDEPYRHGGERRACVVCGHTERATIHTDRRPR
jgi:hypothetical protein